MARTEAVRALLWGAGAASSTAPPGLPASPPGQGQIIERRRTGLHRQFQIVLGMCGREKATVPAHQVNAVIDQGQPELLDRTRIAATLKVGRTEIGGQFTRRKASAAAGDQM